MPTLIRLEGGRAVIAARDPFAEAPLDGPLPDGPAVLMPLARFQQQGPALLDEGLRIGVLLQPEEAVEDLAYDLPRLSMVALNLPKFRDGRAYSTAALLRQRYAFKGEVRAVGEVLREQAHLLARVGVDAFVFADGTTPEQLEAKLSLYRHVYQAASDARPPAWAERRS